MSDATFTIQFHHNLWDLAENTQYKVWSSKLATLDLRLALEMSDSCTALIDHFTVGAMLQDINFFSFPCSAVGICQLGAKLFAEESYLLGID